MTDEILQNLTPRQQKGLACLLSEPSIEAAATSAKVTRQTLYEWLREPQFKAAYEHLQQEVFAEGLSTLKASLSEGVTALRQALKDPEATPANRIAAATKLIELSLKAREQFELGQRLEQLEQLFQAQSKKGATTR
jgi:hypothetical protein